MKIIAILSILGLVSAQSCWRSCTDNNTAVSECGDDEPYLCCNKWYGGNCCTPAYATCNEYCVPCTRETISHDCPNNYKCCENGSGSGCCTVFHRDCPTGNDIFFAQSAHHDKNRSHHNKSQEASAHHKSGYSYHGIIENVQSYLQTH